MFFSCFSEVSRGNRPRKRSKLVWEGNVKAVLLERGVAWNHTLKIAEIHADVELSVKTSCGIRGPSGFK